jgi:hypothetical protein
MFNGNYTHVRDILERVQRDYAFVDVYADEAKEWIWDCMGYFGRDEILVPTIEDVDITNNRGLLPNDVYRFIGCRDVKTKRPLLPTTDRYFHKNFMTTNALGQAIVQGQSVNITTRGVGDNVVEQIDVPTTFLEFTPTIDLPSLEEWTYELNNGYIFCGVSNVTIQVAYLGFPMWDDGTPKVPDDPKVIRMIVLHIAERIANRLWMQDKLIKQKLDDIRDELAWSVGSAQNRMKMVGEDGMESIKRSLMRLVPKPDQWKNGFREMNRGEHLNKM